MVVVVGIDSTIPNDHNRVYKIVHPWFHPLERCPDAILESNHHTWVEPRNRDDDADSPPKTVRDVVVFRPCIVLSRVQRVFYENSLVDIRD